MSEKSGMKDLINSFLKYLVVGGGAFVIDFSVLEILHKVFGVHKYVAVSCGFCTGLIVTYICSNKFVFSNRKMADKKAAEFTIFTIIGIIGLLMTNLFMWLFTDVCSEVWVACNLSNLAVEISKIITAGLVLIWNFVARKVILF